jgi:hypothetical protein
MGENENKTLVLLRNVVLPRVVVLERSRVEY